MVRIRTELGGYLFIHIFVWPGSARNLVCYLFNYLLVLAGLIGERFGYGFNGKRMYKVSGVGYYSKLACWTRRIGPVIDYMDINVP